MAVVGTLAGGLRRGYMGSTVVFKVLHPTQNITLCTGGQEKAE